MMMMIMRGLREVMVVAIVVATPLVVGPGAFADPGDASHVDEVTAVLGSEGIAVTGQATFVDVPGVVGEDADDDAVGSAAPLGHELTTATISRPDPFSNPFVDIVRFTLEIAKQPPETNGVPEFVEYRWDVSTEQGDFTLLAYRSSRWPEPTDGVDPRFLMCTDGTCRAFPLELTGSMGDGLVAWNVPLLEIGQVGSVITSVDGIKVMSSASGSGSMGSSLFDVTEAAEIVLDDMATDTAYTVPGPVVRIGIAPAGAAPEDVPLTTVGAVNSQGAFNGRLPTPDTPGDYIVVARACYGADNCGAATTTITV